MPPPRAPGPRVRGAGAPGAAHLPSSFSPRYGSGSASAGGRPEGCAASRGCSDPDGRVPPDSAGGLPARPGLCPSQQAMREREPRRRWRFLRVGAAGGSHHLCLHPTGQGQSHDHTQLQGDPGVPLSRARRRKGSRSGGRRPVSARAPAAGRQVPAPFPHCPSRVPEGAPEPRAAPGCGSPVGIPGRCALFSVPSRGPASWCRDDELKEKSDFLLPSVPVSSGGAEAASRPRDSTSAGPDGRHRAAPGSEQPWLPAPGATAPSRRGSPLQQPSARFPRGSLVSPSPRSPGSSWSSFSMATLEQLPGPLLLFEGRTASAALRWLPEVFYGARRQFPFF